MEMRNYLRILNLGDKANISRVQRVYTRLLDEDILIKFNNIRLNSIPNALKEAC